MSEGIALPNKPASRETTAEKAKQYVVCQPLWDAVEVALDLGMPLLVTGEPGTGKTLLAHHLSWKLYHRAPEVFHTKSVSVYTDLFYYYDAMLHFQESRVQGQQHPVDRYIRFEALGKAILRARNKELADHERRTVVLIDEIDKAPRDFPNDILNEIEEMRFRVKETGAEYEADPEYKPVLVFTSNQEKDLPDAFRRRCIFFNIRFDDLDLAAILQSRVKAKWSAPEELVTAAIGHFREIRKKKLEKLPAIAELVEWLKFLAHKKVSLSEPYSDETKRLLAVSYSLLAKSDEDLKLLNPPKSK